MANHRQIGGYDVTSRLGGLPLGEAFSGRDAEDRPVTLLRLDRDALLGRMDLESLLQSVATLRDLDIPGVLPVIGAGQKGGDIVVVIRGTDGPTLEDVLARGALDAGRVVRIARQIAESLERLHRAETPHGDVCPANIHLPGGGEALLGPPAFLPSTRGELDPAFTAPEMLDGEVGEPASDIFSLGAIVYQALTGRSPFPGKTADQVLRSIRSGVVEDPTQHAPDLPPGLPDLLLRMLDETAAMRPTDVATRLREIEEAPVVEADPVEVIVEVAPSAPVVSPPAAPRVPAATGGPRTRAGRLLLPRLNKEEALQYDLLDDSTHLGVGGEGEILVAAEPFDGAMCRLAREPMGDVIEARPGASERARVNGSLFDRHDLVEGDVIALAGAEVRYELEPAVARPAIRPAPGAGRPAKSRSERVFLAVSLVLSVLIIAGIAVVYGNAANRGQHILDQAEEERSKAIGRFSHVESREDVEEAAAAALAEALALARSAPQDYTGRRELLEAVLSRHPGTRASRQASDALDAFHKEEAQAEMQELADAIAEADRLVDESRLHDASRVFRAYATRWKGTPSAARADRNAARIERKIELRFEVDGEQIDALVRSGDIVGALDRLGQVLVYASPKVQKLAQERMEELRRRIDETLSVPDGGPAPEEATEPGAAHPAAGSPEEAPKPLPEAKDPREEARKRSEERAQKVLDAAFEDARSGLFGRVRELTRLLLTSLAPTEVAKKNRRQVELLFRLATLESDGPAGLLHGKVEHLGKERIRVSYDFRDPEQLKDWTYLKPFAVPEGGSFKPVPGKALLQGKGAGAFLLDLVVQGDLTMSFRFNSERPHDVGPALFDPDNEMRHILFAVSNTFFTLSINRDPLPGHVILLFGRGAWADTPFGELGFIRVAQSDDPPVAAGSWLYMACGRKGKEAFFSLGNKKLTGSTLGDDKKGYGDLRPAFFVLKSRAQFADVVVEGKPSRIWVAEHKAELRKLLDLNR